MGRACVIAVLCFFLLAAPAAAQVPAPLPLGHDTSRKLAAEAQELAETLRKKFGDGYVTRIDNQRHLVYVSALDAKMLDHAVAMLAGLVDAHQRSLFPRALAANVTVVLPTLSDYHALKPPEKMLGFYKPSTRTLVSISLSSVIFHELTHALHHNDQVLRDQRHPIWISEGLATLFQSVRVSDGRLDPRLDGSLKLLQDAIREKAVGPLATLCRMDRDAFMTDADRHYAQARHVMFYLSTQRKLRDFYDAYKAGYGDDPHGVAALEKVLGKPVDTVDAEWRAWVLARQLPWQPARAARAHLGVRMEKTEEGVWVTGFLRGSAAARAGLIKPGDVIISVAGRPTPDAAELKAAVQSCRPGETVEIELIREGKTLSVNHLLGAAGR